MPTRRTCTRRPSRRPGNSRRNRRASAYTAAAASASSSSTAATPTCCIVADQRTPRGNVAGRSRNSANSARARSSLPSMACSSGKVIRTSGIGGAMRDQPLPSGADLADVAAQDGELDGERDRQPDQRDVADLLADRAGLGVRGTRLRKVATQRGKHRGAAQVMPASGHRAVRRRDPVDRRKSRRRPRRTRRAGSRRRCATAEPTARRSAGSPARRRPARAAQARTVRRPSREP